MNRTIAILCHLPIFAAVIGNSHSTSEFLVAGFGLSLLLDRYIVRVFRWRPISWKREIGLRVGSFVVGSLFFYFIRPGIVPTGEAIYRGVMTCFACAIAEQLSLWIGELLRSRWVGIGIVGASIVAISPAVVFLHPLHTVPKRGPESLGLAFEDVRFSSDDGTKLAGWLIPAEHARGNIIFCHGHGRCRGQALSLLPLYHSLDLNVLAFDFRGHGDSEGHVSTLGDREVADLRAATRYVRERFPGRPLILAGVSLGAAVSLKSLPELGQVDGVWSEGAFARLDHEIDHEFQWLPHALRIPVERMYYLLGWIDCRMWAPRVNPVDGLTRDDVPISFCHGRKDELVPLSEGQTLYDCDRGPKQCWWVEDATHYNVRQRYRDEYQRRLGDFICTCLARAGKSTPHLDFGRSIVEDHH